MPTNYVGQYLKNTRKRKGVSVEELADCASLSTAAIYKYEAPGGKTGLSENLKRVAQCLEIDDAVLLDIQNIARSIQREGKTEVVIFGYDDLLAQTKISPLDLQSFLLNPDGHLNQSLEIDHSIHGSPEQWVIATEGCRSLFRVAFDLAAYAQPNVKAEECILGYWQCIIITEQGYEKFSKGELIDSEIVSTEYLLPDFVAQGECCIFCVAAFASHSATTQLYRSYAEAVRDMAVREQPVYFSKICAGPETPLGEITCASSIGLTHFDVRQKITNNKIYVGSYYPPTQNKFFERFGSLSKDLLEIYSDSPVAAE